MVDLGGYRIHLYCTGKDKQTIVLSPGGGDFSFVWDLVQQQVQTFAEGYPDETTGMVLVDAPGPDDTLGYFGKLVRVRTLAHRTIPSIQTMKTSPSVPISDAEREQAMKYKSHKISPPYDLLPPKIQKLQLWAQALPSKVAITEKDDYIPEEFQLLYEIQQFGHPLGRKPLITMIGMQGVSEEKFKEKKAFQTLSINSKVVEVQDAGHAIHLQDPDAVVSAIHDVMNAALHHARLKR